MKKRDYEWYYSYKKRLPKLVINNEKTHIIFPITIWIIISIQAQNLAKL